MKANECKAKCNDSVCIYFMHTKKNDTPFCNPVSQDLMITENGSKMICFS